jgi:SAM-dependent methyltransferase
MTFSEFYEASDFKSDKGTTHDYINGYYSNEFTSKRNDKLKILEIGVHEGRSVKLLREWFVNSEITGIDPFGNGLVDNIADEIRKMGDINIIQNDAYTENVLDMFEDNSIDYLIDDGPHTLDSQLFAIEYWFKKVKPGGIMIIEDIQKLDRDKEKIDELCYKLELHYETIDLRDNKNRYDDVLLIFKKNG